LVNQNIDAVADASYVPESKNLLSINCADGDKHQTGYPGFGRSPTIAFPGAVKTLTPSVFDVMGVVMCVVSFFSYDAASVNRT